MIISRIQTVAAGKHELQEIEVARLNRLLYITDDTTCGHE